METNAIGLDKLLIHAEITENSLVALAIKKHVEQFVLEFFYSNGVEFIDDIQAHDVKDECVANTDPGTDIGVSPMYQRIITFVDGLDIWLTVSCTVLAYWTDGFDDQDWEINFDSIKLYWLNEVFDMEWSMHIKTMITNKILSDLS